MQRNHAMHIPTLPTTRILSVFSLLKRVGFALLVCVQLAWGQWTEPEPMEPDFGTAMTAVWISNDGLRLYLSAGLAFVGWTERDSVNEEWGQWTALPPHINASNTQTSMCESPSGDTLYFTSNSDERGDGFGWMDIYYCVRTDTGWGPAVNAGPNVNGTGREWSVGISRDGSILLVAGQMPEDASHSLYYCNLQSDGTWGPKISFGAGVNTWHDEEHPSLSSNNSRLFFSQVDAPDMWVSDFVDSVWTAAVPLPYPVNSEDTEMNPCLANDGRTLWYRKGRLQSGYRIVTSVDTTAVGVGPQEYVSVDEYELHVFPNPFNSTTRITLSLPPHIHHAELRVHNLLGQVVLMRELNAENGQAEFALDGTNLATGVYLVSARAGESIATQKVMLLK